ncbi:MAG: hypothetical protein WAV41_03705 [Microgenomates group bacterium]
MNYELRINKNKGQVALIVLLISAVVMTVGLSVSRKTVVDTKIDTNEEQLKQAFNAAESGIEYYLGTGETKFVAMDSLSRANVKVTNIGQGTTINYNQLTLVNNTLQYWLVGHLADGGLDYATYYTGTNLSVCVNSGFGGALKVDYFYRDAGSNFIVAHQGFNTSAGYVSGFSDTGPVAGSGNCITGYREIALTTPLGGGIVPLLLSIKPIGSGARMYLYGDGGSAFPVQGIVISSTGMAGDSAAATGASRKINVTKLYQLPAFAMEAITTYGNVLSN